MKNLKNQKGFLLAPFLGLLLIMLSLGLSYMRASQMNTAILRNDGDSEQAFYVMEAGLEDAMAQMRANMSWNTGFQNKVFQNGTYTVTVQDALPYKQVTSTATLNGKSIQSKGKVLASVGTNAFVHAIHSGKDVHLDPAIGLVTGGLTAADNAHVAATMVVVGTTTEDSTDQTPVPNWSNWQNAATTVINGNYTFPSGVYTGIWYVNGKATLSSNLTLTGTIVATDKIDFKNTTNIVINGGSTMTALISGDHVEGNSASNVSISGVIYGDKGVNFNSQVNTSYVGSIVGGDFHANSATNLTIAYDTDLAVNIPYYFTDADAAAVKVIAWQ